MQQYNMLQAVFMSFYSKSLYRDVAKNWGGKAFLYLFLLLLIIWIPTTILIQKAINARYQEFAAQAIPQLPAMDIQNGKISTPENHPYIIKNSEGKIIAVIDASGKYKTLEEAGTDILITKTEVIVHDRDNETKIHTLPDDLNMSLSPESINNFLTKFIGYLWIFIYLPAVLGAYLYRIIQALIYSLIGKLFAKTTGTQIQYGEILQIALVSITPAILIGTLLEFVPVAIPYSALIYLSIGLLYLFFGISANKTKL